MGRTEFTFENKDDILIQVYKWTPTTSVKGIVCISHGMSETALRYDAFANALSDEGYVVYAHDHRGHGKSAKSMEELGYVSDNDGFFDMVEDVKKVVKLAKEEYPGQDVVLFSHSMGSFLAQRYIQLYGGDLAGVILSGTNGKPPWLVNVGIVVAKTLMTLKGRKADGKLLDKLTFGSYNRPFEPADTPFDWLSRDKEQVKKYIDDPYCGNVFPVSFYHDLFMGTKEIHKQEYIHEVPKELPIYIFAGDKDPVGDFGQGIIRLYDAYKKAGIKNVSYKLYEGGRHESLNEINRDEVIKDTITWLNKVFS
ncbi:alpha/beta hydrolase [Alkalihalobacillus sp. LMS39]|uniref:alpha/beta hydrolase n=1 Tax=Alkalihalobacillus sp. LMS39 TaxID=2924032 RepID=UPI001FB2F68B|nr:alpha/beta hydrolase [Alkalihalobacillus sp. LMS39]UOE94576.1 alpha/beta hydrolase [Alkalihalobacillus sp. LMS39]